MVLSLLNRLIPKMAFSTIIKLLQLLSILERSQIGSISISIDLMLPSGKI